MTVAVRDAVKLLLALRHGELIKVPFPVLTSNEAYQVQASVVEALGESVAGWKIALVNGKPVAAPLVGSTLKPSGVALPFQSKECFKIETELSVRLRSDLPPRSQVYKREEIVDAIESVAAAFEIIGPRNGEPPETSFAVFLADNLGNALTVVGGAKPMVALPAAAQLFRQRILVREGGHPYGDPLSGLVAYANAPSDLLGGLRKGQIIITGSFTGVESVRIPGLFAGHFEGLPPVTVEFTL